MSSFDLDRYLKDRSQTVEQALQESLPVIYPESLCEAMRYSLLAGGKRLRPILCLAGCELCGGTVEQALPTAVALEMIHTMSLIHDDLPAMDNDDFRRGKPTNHKVFGEAMAILAGDALLAYAFAMIAKTKAVSSDRLLQVIDMIASASSHYGLVGGQVLDLAMEGNPNVDEQTLHYIHTHKTGALLKACVLSGAVLGGGNELDLANLSVYAENIGLAFQIVDDILDVTSTTEKLGKTAGKDERDNKVTYPKLWGLETSRQRAQELITEAKAKLNTYGEKAMPLQSLADFIVQRDR
ncbi:MAG: geranylgeranyl diphosphate synthase CrtE [Pseudanabaenaceae cyanobacterium]